MRRRGTTLYEVHTEFGPCVHPNMPSAFESISRCHLLPNVLMARPSMKHCRKSWGSRTWCALAWGKLGYDWTGRRFPLYDKTCPDEVKAWRTVQTPVDNRQAESVESITGSEAAHQAIQSDSPGHRESRFLGVHTV